jgi:hypothetical protein
MNATPHKHAALIKQWADAPEWWDVYFREPATSAWTKVALTPGWAPNYEYELRESAEHPDKHPENKPKKRLIDWSKMPRGTMTSGGTFLSVYGYYANILQSNDRLVRILLSELRLKEQTQFTYWGGGECPVPEGVVGQVIFRKGNIGGQQDISKYGGHLWAHHNNFADTIAYRITGLADEWTDVPEDAV